MEKIAHREMEDKKLVDLFVCCGEQMSAVGLGYCNGWKCKKCGKIIEDTITISSGKTIDK